MPRNSGETCCSPKCDMSYVQHFGTQRGEGSLWLIDLEGHRPRSGGSVCPLRGQNVCGGRSTCWRQGEAGFFLHVVFPCSSHDFIMRDPAILGTYPV